ncbi:MAG: hypothetical protein IJ920_03600 [Paludibacteraceae bacterium]|nr:hypothetical protein [Paludibacteraceae bacterium]
MMKRICKYLFSLAVACIFCSCGQTGDGQGTATDTIVQDTIIVAEQLEPEPEPEPPFTSPDLKWLRMQGPVKKVVFTSRGEGEATETYKFNKQGILVSYKDQCDDYNLFHRNKLGQIVKWEGEGAMAWEYAYEYNSEGYVCSDEFFNEDVLQDRLFVLNEKGWILSSKVSGMDIEVKFKGTEHYSYSIMDKYGNWCKCVVKERIRFADGATFKNNTTITRKITYWE